MLLVVMLVSGVLMGMSGTEDTGLKLSVKKVSKADEGREIYTGQESVSLVLAWNEHAEGTAASDVQWIMCRGRDHLGYQKEEKRQTEGRGTMTYVPDLSVFADGEVTFSFWAVDQAGNTGEEAQIVLMKMSAGKCLPNQMSSHPLPCRHFCATPKMNSHPHSLSAHSAYMKNQNSHPAQKWIPDSCPNKNLPLSALSYPIAR